MRKPTTVEDWARTAQFAEPIQWGEVEDAVLSRRLPPAEGERLRGLRVALKAVVALLALAIYGASVIGLVAVLLAMSSGADGEGDPWVLLARVAFLVALAALVATVVAWLGDGRRRGPWDVAVSAVTGASAGTAGVVTITGMNGPGATGILALVAAAAGVVAFIFLVSASTGRNEGRRRWSIDPVKDRRYLEARKTVLRVLTERGLAEGISPGQRQQLETAPFGSWHEFDGAPDDR